MGAAWRRRGDLGLEVRPQAGRDRRPRGRRRRDHDVAGTVRSPRWPAPRQLGDGVGVTIGGLLFAIGAAVAQFGSGDATTSASIYFAGGLFFNTGGYASLLSAINAPRSVDEGGKLVTGRWRWWSYEPDRIDWASAFVLFVGTLAFGISLLDSFLNSLSNPQVNRLIWAPEM